MGRVAEIQWLCNGHHCEYDEECDQGNVTQLMQNELCISQTLNYLELGVRI